MTAGQGNLGALEEGANRRALGVFGNFRFSLTAAGPREVPRDPLRQVEGDAEVPVWMDIGYIVLGTNYWVLGGRVFFFDSLKGFKPTNTSGPPKRKQYSRMHHLYPFVPFDVIGNIHNHLSFTTWARKTAYPSVTLVVCQVLMKGQDSSQAQREVSGFQRLLMEMDGNRHFFLD